MFRRLFLITLAMALLTVAQGQSIESKKCRTCGKPLKECRYKGRHPQKESMRQISNREPVGTNHPNNKTQNFASNNTINSSSLKSRKIKVGEVEFTMVYVEGGDYLMGVQKTEKNSPNYDPNAPYESTVHNETLQDFFIGQTEVTQGLWEAVTGMTFRQQREVAIADDNYGKKYYPNDYVSLFYAIKGEGSDYPMYYVSRSEIIAFIEILNRLTGEKFRLPTEAEWEYASRGGNRSESYLYSGSNFINDVAWYSDNSNGKIHPVAQKKPNELGLYDMSGNVWEMCEDCASPADCRSRAERGGAFNEKKNSCTPSRRMGEAGGARPTARGFRLAMDR